MKLDELIKRLERIRRDEGNLYVGVKDVEKFTGSEFVEFESHITFYRKKRVEGKDIKLTRDRIGG